MTSEHRSRAARTGVRTAHRLVELFSSGDFDSDESRRLTAALYPRSLLLRAVERIARGDRLAAWRDVRAAVDAAPRDGLVHALSSRLLYALGDFRHALDAAQIAWDLGVLSAGMLRYHQARDVGRYDVACAALDDVLRSREQGRSAELSDHVFEYALEHLLGLYFDHHHDGAAAATLHRYFPSARGSFPITLQAARIYDRCGEAEKAQSAIRDALQSMPSDAHSRLKAATILLEIGAFDEARATYESLRARPETAPAALEALARLALWKGDVQQALDYADQLGDAVADSSAAQRIRAAALVVRGEFRQALPLLDGVLAADPHDAEAHLWRAEVKLRLRQSQDAATSADRSRQYGNSFAASAIHLLAALPPTESPDVVRTSTASARSRAEVGRRGTRGVNGAIFHAQQELQAELTALVPEASEILGTASTTKLARALEDALATMRGNRTRLGTWVRPDGALARVPPTAAPRFLSREAFELIRVAPADESFRRLDALAGRFPDSSMPLVHRGELHLWLGQYAEARADLERAIAIRRETRWAWYGLAWLHIITGDPAGGLATCAQGIAVMSNTEGPPAFGCRGAAYRLLGRLDEARAQLQRSCELNPTRLSAWVDLALVHGATGDRPRQAAVFDRLARVAAPLMSHAALELGDDVFTEAVLAAPLGDANAAERIPPEMITRLLQHVLVMMRGNRASSLITYFTADGRMHHVPRQSEQQSSRVGQHGVDRVRGVLLRALDGRDP